MINKGALEPMLREPIEHQPFGKVPGDLRVRRELFKIFIDPSAGRSSFQVRALETGWGYKKKVVPVMVPEQ